MAGQPQSRAKRFGVWEDRLWELLVELSHLLPPGRLDKQPSEDKLDFWIETFRSLEWTTIPASALRYELEDKAGWDAEKLEKEREVARGLWGDEGGATEGANQAAT